MNPALLPIIKKIIDEIVERIPNPAERERKRAELEAAAQAAEQQGMADQREINKVEAAHRSIFVAGWRPFIGWVGGSALAWMYVLKPVIGFALAAAGVQVVLPDLIEPENLIELIFVLLGVGSMRTFEKWKGVNHR